MKLETGTKEDAKMKMEINEAREEEENEGDKVLFRRRVL